MTPFSYLEPRKEERRRVRLCVGEENQKKEKKYKHEVENVFNSLYLVHKLVKMLEERRDNLDEGEPGRFM